jgi:circadian clock protein KaiB
MRPPARRGGQLRLYIASNSASSQRAVKQLAAVQAALGPDWEIEVVDVLADPELAERVGLLATPTLAYEHPQRPRRVVGNLSDTNRVLAFLGIDADMKE